MKKKLVLIAAVCGCTAVMMTGCGKDKISIESRTDSNITVNTEKITYNPEEETAEADAGQISTAEDVDTMHAGSENTADGNADGSLFKFGVTSDDIADSEDVTDDGNQENAEKAGGEETR